MPPVGYFREDNMYIEKTFRVGNDSVFLGDVSVSLN